MSKALWTSADIAKATGGKASGDFTASGLSIDTRTIEAGDLFVPLKDVRDGHDFIPMAMEKGAGGTLSEIAVKGPAVIVKDSLQALRDLGKEGVERSQALRIAVTGSVGKTSVKEALAHMFTAFGNTHKSLKSYNNHWGVPLTMARMPQETDFGVFEMGMNHAGELSDLSTLLRPDIALITTVAAVHLAHFENVEAIADAKAEIIEGLSKDGIVILNADNAYTPRIAATVKGNKIIYFGYDDNADVRIISADVTAQGSQVSLVIDGAQIDIDLNIPGEHWVSNAASCMAVAHAAGLDLTKAAKALSGVQAEGGRGEISELSIDGKFITLIDEAYNANPTSMTAAIKLLGLKSGRRLAVLGDMAELGKDELAMHAGLTEPLEDAGVARVIVAGECMRALRGALPQPMRGAWTQDWAGALGALKGEIQDGDVVLVKGSNSAGLGKLVAALKGKTV